MSIFPWLPRCRIVVERPGLHNVRVGAAQAVTGLLIFSYFTTVSNPFALSLSKGLQRACPEFAEGLRQAQPERCHVLRKHQ
jgi:hypothetical protein